MKLKDFLVNVLSDKSCLLCFKTTSTMWHLFEEFEIKCEYFDIKTNLRDMLMFLFPKFDMTQSHLCYTCSDLLIKMYIAFKRQKHLEHVLFQSVENMLKKLQVKNYFDLKGQIYALGDETVVANPLFLNLTSKNEEIENKTNSEIEPLHQTITTTTIVPFQRTRKKKNYNCKICAYKTLCKATLDGHMNKNHFNIRPFKCNMCWKGFYRKSNLVEHIKSHNNSKELCELCGDSFRQKKSLIEHLRLHSNSRPYECNVCGKKFVTSGRRLDHKKRNHLVKTESCMFCNKPFGLKKELTRHMKNVHTKL